MWESLGLLLALVVLISGVITADMEGREAGTNADE